MYKSQEPTVDREGRAILKFHWRMHVRPLLRWFVHLFRYKFSGLPQEPTIHRDGRVDFESLRQMPNSTLAEWIARVLLHDDARIAGQRDDEYYLYLGRLYKELPAATRECFQDAVLRLLAHVASCATGEPTAPPAEELLLLISEIFRDSEEQRRSDPVPYLLKMAEEKPGTHPPKVHFRILLTLVDLHYPADVGFWNRQFERDKEDFAGVVFAGLSVLGLEEAFTWLIQNASRPKAFAALLSRLPLLLQQHPKDRIEEWLQEYSRLLSQEQLASFQDYTRNFLKLSIDTPPLGSLADGELGILARGLGLASVLEHETRQKRLAALDSQLRSRLPTSLITSEAAPKSVLSLLAVCRQLSGPQARKIPQDLTSKILEEARSTAENLSDERFFWELMAAISAAEDPYIEEADLAKHFEEGIEALA